MKLVSVISPPCIAGAVLARAIAVASFFGHKHISFNVKA